MKNILIVSIVFLLSSSFQYTGTEGRPDFTGNQIMLFYSDWSPECKQIKSQFEQELPKMCKDNNLDVEIVLVNSYKGGALIQQYKVTSFPTILLKTSDGQIIKYIGQRTPEAIVRFIKGGAGC